MRAGVTAIPPRSGAPSSLPSAPTAGSASSGCTPQPKPSTTPPPGLGASRRAWWPSTSSPPAAGPRCRYKTLVAVEQAAARALSDAEAERWIEVTIAPVTAETFRQENRGRPGPDTRYRKTTTERFALSFKVSNDKVAHDARMDGIFPLITNDKKMEPAEVLAAYKYQPNLERRHGQLKGHQLVAPVLLKDPVRIEGLLCCHFFALLVQALIEREIRAAMVKADAAHIPLYPVLRACAAPSAARVLEIFSGLSRHHLMSRSRLIQTFHPELSPLQLQVLQLLGVPASTYTS